MRVTTVLEIESTFLRQKTEAIERAATWADEAMTLIIRSWADEKSQGN